MNPTDRLFLDTSDLLSLHDGGDLRHAAALKAVGAAPQLFITDYILAEFIPLSQIRGHQRQAALAFVAAMLEVSRLRLIWIDRRIHNAAMELLSERLDKRYSLCDAVSFVVMREHEVLSALATDKHFKQEGFVRLLHG